MTIAVYPGMTAELALRHYLLKSQVDPDKIKYVKLPPPEHEPALMRGDVQAVHVYEPFRSACLQNNKTRELTGSIYAALNEPSAIGASVISRKFYSDNRVIADRFLDAWNEAIRFIREKPSEARKILAARLGLPDSIAAAATWIDATATDETNFAILQNTVSSLKEAGIIPDAFILEKDMVLR